ncbi:MAG: carboxypeptidase regulatory-like domain-containing protein [Thermoanaerobaculia bacterium]
MKRFTLLIAVAAMVAAPLVAGDLHGKVVAKGLRNSADAVVYIDAIPGKTFTPPANHPVMNQKDMSFVPHVLPVVVGTTVDFLNDDPFLHNVFSPDKCADRFNLGSWPKGQTRSYTFKRQCMATLLCAVHPEMEAYILALPTSYYAVTASDGSYTIKDLPDGQYTVEVWHPKLKQTSRPVKVSGKTELDFELSK